MSEKRSIFFDEWQACLRAHYRFVIQDNDTVTEPTLRHVLLQTGLAEDELDALAEEACADVPLDSATMGAGADDVLDDVDAEMADDPARGQMALF